MLMCMSVLMYLFWFCRRLGLGFLWISHLCAVFASCYAAVLLVLRAGVCAATTATAWNQTLATACHSGTHTKKTTRSEALQRVYSPSSSLPASIWG